MAKAPAKKKPSPAQIAARKKFAEMARARAAAAKKKSAAKKPAAKKPAAKKPAAKKPAAKKPAAKKPVRLMYVVFIEQKDRPRMYYASGSIASPRLTDARSQGAGMLRAVAETVAQAFLRTHKSIERAGFVTKTASTVKKKR